MVTPRLERGSGSQVRCEHPNHLINIIFTPLYSTSTALTGLHRHVVNRARAGHTAPVHDRARGRLRPTACARPLARSCTDPALPSRYRAPTATRRQTTRTRQLQLLRRDLGRRAPSPPTGPPSPTRTYKTGHSVLARGTREPRYTSTRFSKFGLSVSANTLLRFLFVLFYSWAK